MISQEPDGPRSSGRYDTERSEDEASDWRINMNHSVTLQKWAGLFDGQGIRLPELKSETTAAYLKSGWSEPGYISHFTPPNVKTGSVAVPIDLETARALRRVLFGDATRTFTRDWDQCYFKFRNPDSAIPYGLEANLAGPRSLILSVNAYVIKHLVFKIPDEEDKIFGRAPPTPTTSEQIAALIDALSDILWKLSQPVDGHDPSENKRNVVIPIPGSVECFETLGYLLADGLIEKLWLYKLDRLDDVKDFFRENLNYFCSEKLPGVVLFVYAMVLTHSTHAITAELGNIQRSLMREYARPTQAFHNFILSGTVSCFLHNGTIRYDGLGRELPVPLVGLRQRSEIGFLFFDKTEENSKRTEVGCMLRTPLLPIWITKVNGSYGLLFCTSRDLVGDWKTERFFSLHYYTGHFSQENATCISIDTRRRAFPDPSTEISYWDDEEEKERKQPSFEKLLGTKWPEAVIDWNGETPYY